MFTIGADPEFFLHRNGVPVSAHDLVPGTKRRPQKVPLGAIQHDGTAAEFNIDPVDTFEEFTTSLQEVMNYITELTGTEYLNSVTVDWGEALFEMPAEAFELGCSPDYDAYTGMENHPPDAKSTMRSAGGHIHLGVGTPDDYDGIFPYQDEMRRLIRLMDKHVGVYSLIWDKDRRRQQLYGKAGAMRFKPRYGVEYRTLSNAWVTNPNLHRIVFDQTQRAVDEWHSGGDGSDTIQDTINNQDVDAAYALGDKDVIEHIKEAA